MAARGKRGGLALRLLDDAPSQAKAAAGNVLALDRADLVAGHLLDRLRLLILYIFAMRGSCSALG